MAGAHIFAFSESNEYPQKVALWLSTCRGASLLELLYCFPSLLLCRKGQASQISGRLLHIDKHKNQMTMMMLQQLLLLVFAILAAMALASELVPLGVIEVNMASTSSSNPESFPIQVLSQTVLVCCLFLFYHQT
jgi:hypothetical protein